MTNIKHSQQNSWHVAFVFCLMALLVLSPELSFATSTDVSGLSEAICKVVTLLTGILGQGIAMIGLIALGIGIFLGKLSWPLALATAIGITLIFSAGKIVGWLTTGTAVTCS